MENRTPLRKAFTLVELLVVIGIIALLISVLLPALGKARAAAQTAACLANLRSMAQAMQIYVAENRGWIPATPIGSAIFKNDNPSGTWSGATWYDAATVPGEAPIYPTDYYAPLLKTMKISLKNGNSPKAEDRYGEYMTLKEFTCPSFIDVLAPPFAGSPSAGVIQSISYVTAYGFLLTSGAPTPGVTGGTRMSTGVTYPALPDGYVPKITKVGQGAEKIFACDGAKFSKNTNTVDYNLTMPATSGWTTTNYSSISNYSDFGPWNMQTSSFDRSWAPGNTKAGTYDQRKLVYRHGGTRDGTYRMNVVFYDGHGETMDEATSSNPKYWIPKGTAFKGNPPGVQDAIQKIWPDEIARYGLNANYVAP